MEVGKKGLGSTPRLFTTISIRAGGGAIAALANTGDMQAELNVVWDKLLPAFHDKPLPENPRDQAKLKQLVSELKAKK